MSDVGQDTVGKGEGEVREDGGGEEVTTEGGQVDSVPAPTTEETVNKEVQQASGDVGEGVTGEAGRKEEGTAVGFPLDRLTRLDEQLGRPKWVVPVRQDDDLELLLRASIRLCKEGRDMEVEACQRFFRDGLTLSFNRILTDDAVSTWKPDIQRDIYNNSVLLVELCATKLSQDWFVLLELLALVLNPQSKWHTYNANMPSDTCSKESDPEKLFAMPQENRPHGKVYGWLLDMINLFGSHGGFQILHDRIIEGENLTVPLTAALIRPFGHCAEFLLDTVYQKYLIPVVDKVIAFLDGLSNDSLKKEATSEARSETFSSIMKSLRHLCRRVEGREDIESFRLKMILRLLQIASFNGKMNALNEINKIIPTVTYHPSFRPQDDDQMQADKLASWIRENNVLAIVFRDNLHQPQYVEKLDKLVRFCIKEKVLSLQDLDRIWAAQDGKHEIIVKNIHDLLVKLAWDFSPEQLDHLFGCFQRCWVGASKKQCEELLEFIRHLAEDDKEGVMAVKVLDLLWNLAHRDDCPPDTMDHALSAHIKILDYSCSQERESQKLHWLQRCVEDLSNEKWVIPALKHMKEICLLYLESPVNYVHSHHRQNQFYYRNEIISHLDTNYHLLSHICQNMEVYMRKARTASEKSEELEPESLFVDSRFNHTQQVTARLDFIRFALKDGQLWLGHQQALMVWESLVEKPAFSSDRDTCFRWFAKLVSDEPDIEPDTVKKIFTENVHRMPPQHLTENGFRCFDRFFRMVNINERRLSAWRRGFITENVDLVGLEYLWKAVLLAPDSIVYKPIELLKDVYTNLSNKLQQDKGEQFHLDFIQTCMQRLQVAYDNLQQFKPGEIENEPTDMQQSFNTEITKLVRCLSLLKEYVIECDEEYQEERGIPAHGKAVWGRALLLVVRYSSHQQQPPEDFEVASHYNETIAAVRRHILQRLKLSYQSRLELSVGNEVLRVVDDRRLVSAVPLRDRAVLNAKLLFSNVSETSMNSSDNSTDSSEGSPMNHLEGPNIEAEKMLPSALIAYEQKNIDFLLSLCDFAIQRGFPQLRDSVRNLLKLLPTGIQLLKELLDHTRQSALKEGVSAYNALQSYFITPSPSRTLYLLEIAHSMLMPAVDFRDPESAEFQVNFVMSGGLKLLLSFLTDKKALANAGNALKRSAMMTVMKMLRLLLTASAYGCIVHVVQEMKTKQVSDEHHKTAMVLQNALQVIIPMNEQKLRHVATMLARQYWEKLTSPLPDISVVRSIQLLAWSAACGDVSLASDPTSIHNAFTKLSTPRGIETEDMHLARDSLEVLCLSMAISPHVLTTLETSQDWKHFVIDALLLVRNRMIRITAADQLFNIVTKCSINTSSFLAFIALLFSAVESVAKDHAPTSGEFFRLLARLLNHAHLANVPITGLDKLLEEELKWLLTVREDTLASPTHQCPVEGPLLDGHLSLLVELLMFRSTTERYHIGSKPGGDGLIEIIMSDFLFPASKLVKEARENPNSEKLQLSDAVSQPICSTTECTQSAFKLLNALCNGSSENISTLHNLLTSYFYSGQDPPLSEWEFIPHIGPRPTRGFVGLKNAGATCYMNAVLQQLYTIPPIRSGIMTVEEAAKELVALEELEREKEREKERKESERKNSNTEVEDPVDPPLESSPVSSSCSGDRKDTQRKVLMQLQSIFAHLIEGRVQFHTPQGFWREFRLWGERVNLREQHDAFEFFNCLVDNLDEGLKTFSYSPVLSEVLGGAFADQKICKGCPHRYSREESFTALNIDIRNQQHLFESLDAFVKGDLLEGANAYHCEKCDKKVDTVKRLCISRLPKVLVIQLKRFDYDWERETAVKFNDYFEFPRELDMSPYTAAKLAKLEGEEIPIPEDTEQKMPGDKPESPVSTRYHLRGIVVHSGQASGGHYYSFIRMRAHGSSSPRWFRFDDGEVMEAKIDDEEEFKSQCFGGDYTGEVYDHVLKKTHYRRQKRWWSAYLLFYDRADQCPVFDEALQNTCTIPQPIQAMVHKQNLEFLHHKSHYNFAYFQFMRNFLLINSNHIKTTLERNPQQPSVTVEMEKLGLQCVQLATTFLFHCGLHTKKTLRGSATEWYEALQPFLAMSPTIRKWFADSVFLQHRQRFSEYLLECPSAEVRNMFAKLITFLCVSTNKDPPIEVSVTTNAGTEKTHHPFSEIALNSLMQLLKKEVADHSRHLNQYFQVFLNYANRGVAERKQLLHLSVPSLFIAVALDEGPGPPLRSPYADLSKLYAVVGILVRSCDVTVMEKSLVEGQDPLPNPFADPDLSFPLPNDLHHWLYERINTQHSTTFTKKMIEDNSTMDETAQFLGFVCWEHWQFSMIVLNDLLMEIAAVQVFDMRPFLDLLSHLLMMQDSWQTHRINTALKGFTHHAEGLITIIQHGQTHYHKRAYLCMKFLVSLTGRCSALHKIVSEDVYVKSNWQAAVKWLNAEMERRPYVAPGYSYSGWSPPAQSNEASNGYYLERSNSAKLTLKRAKELFPIEESAEEQETVIPPGGDPDAGMPADQAEIHGTDRHPAPDTEQPSQQETGTGPNEQGHPPVSNDPHEPGQSSPVTTSPNEQDRPPVRTSPVEQDRPLGTDTIDNIDADVTPIDNTVDSNENVTVTPAAPDSD